MGRSSQYNHYMQRVDSPGFSIIDIEEEFPGLLYSSAKGIYDIGKPKNIYTEQYADSDRTRVYIPIENLNGQLKHDTSLIANEATTVEMTFLVVGDADTRRDVITAFEDYVRTGIHMYYDTARQMKFNFFVSDAIKVSEEKWHGTQPYVEMTVPLQNINGKTRHEELPVFTKRLRGRVEGV